MDCSTPSFPDLHYLLEFVQTHVHWVGDAIQPSHPLLSPFLPTPSLSQHQVLFHESALCIMWLKYWSFSISLSNEYSYCIKYTHTVTLRKQIPCCEQSLLLLSFYLDNLNSFWFSLIYFIDIVNIFSWALFLTFHDLGKLIRILQSLELKKP